MVTSERVTTASLCCLPPVMNGHIKRNHSFKTKNEFLSKIFHFSLPKLILVEFLTIFCTKSGQLWRKRAFFVIFNITPILWNAISCG